MDTFDRSQSLEKIEGQAWPRDDFQSHVVQETQRLRKIPVEALTIEDLRLLIGQKIALRYLVPIAIEKLIENPFVEGNYYRGDLLTSVVSIPQSFWDQHPELNNDMVDLAREVCQVHELLVKELLSGLKLFEYK